MRSSTVFLVLAVSAGFMSTYAIYGDNQAGYLQPIGGSSANYANQTSSYHTPYPPSTPPTLYPPGNGTGCNQPEIAQAQSELTSAEQNYLNLKTSYYQNWTQLSAAGKYNGTWSQYAADNLLNSVEAIKIRNIHEQDGGLVHYCYPAPQAGGSISMVTPVTNSGTIGGILSTNGTASVAPSTSKTTDVLMELEPPTSIPLWVKNNAKWWAQDQISDSDFISSLQYLSSHKIIQLYSSPLSVNNTSTVLPQWVKSTAGSWAEGSVSNDYVTAVQYLADQNIIKVSN